MAQNIKITFYDALVYRSTCYLIYSFFQAFPLTPDAQMHRTDHAPSQRGLSDL